MLPLLKGNFRWQEINIPSSNSFVDGFGSCARWGGSRWLSRWCCASCRLPSNSDVCWSWEVISALPSGPVWSVEGKAILQWRHNGHDGLSNHQPHDCLLNHLLRLRSKKTSKLHVTGLYAGNSPVTGEFPAQMASNAEKVSIWWCHLERGTSWIIEAWIKCMGF